MKFQVGEQVLVIIPGSPTNRINEWYDHYFIEETGVGLARLGVKNKANGHEFEITQSIEHIFKVPQAQAESINYIVLEE